MPSLRKTLINTMAIASGKLIGQMSVSDQEALAKHIGSQRTRNDATHFSNFAKSVSEHYNGITNTLWTNGEKELIDKTAQLNFKTVFDVGANIGNWTKLAYAAHSIADIHGFEIVPDTFEILKQNTKDMGERVHINDFGLSDVDGTVDVSVDPSSNVLASMLDFSEEAVTPNQNETVLCHVKQGADYCAKAGVAHIDLLKIDVEGAEWRVLQGFMPMIESRKIRVIQFEYNRGAIISHFLLRDFYKALQPLGYRLGKLFPDGVKFHDYTLAHEDFQGPNYVACLETDSDVLDTLSL